MPPIGPSEKRVSRDRSGRHYFRVSSPGESHPDLLQLMKFGAC